MKQKKWSIAMLTLVVILSMLASTAAMAQDSTEQLPGSGWWTGVQIQNIGTAPATVEVTSYSTTAGSATIPSGTFNIEPNASTTKLPDDLSLGTSFQGSATVSSNQPLRAIVNTTNLLAAGYGIAGGLAAGQYQGVNTPSTEVNFPLVKNSHVNKTTTFFIQNAGTDTAPAFATFKVGNPDKGFPVVTKTFTTPPIEPGRMFVLAPSNAGVPSGTDVSLGSLTVTSTQPLAGVVLEHSSVETLATQLQATRGFSPDDRDTTIYAPIIKSEFGATNLIRFTGLQIQNTTTGPIDLTITYQGSGGTCAGQSFSKAVTGLPAGQSKTLIGLPGPDNPLPAGCLASAKVVATGEVVAIVNEAYTPATISAGGNGGRNESTTYSAFSGADATAKISAPLYKQNSFNKGTGLQVQNVGTANAAVVVTFIRDTTTFKTLPQTIPPGGSQTFFNMATPENQALFDGAKMPVGTEKADGKFAVVVTADQPIVAVANETTFPIGTTILLQDKNNYEGFNLQP